MLARRVEQESIDAGTHGTPPSPGSTMGRYIVVAEIGRGGTGQVFRAYDPKLRREVALKRMHTEAMSDAGRARVVAEARAMAQLSHPNVVAVFDVEDAGGEVLLVMEFVAGPTLDRWLTAQPRRGPEIVRMFVEAGRGLDAAHRAGLLHCDFKPSNVIVGPDGRPRVTDFGLAIVERWARTLEGSSPDARSGDEPDGTTTRGPMIGTPGFMAPEQHRQRAELTAATDQWAFCAALWHALTGSLPYAIEQRSPDEIGRAKLAEVPPWPKSAPVSSALANAIRRGLAPDPGSRWPSMAALGAALSQHDAARRGRIAVGLAGGLVSIGAAWAVGHVRAEPCADAQDQIDRVWNPRLATAMESAFAGTGHRQAAEVVPRLRERLDAYAARWAEDHTSACRATSVQHEQSTADLDLRMACLQRARAELRSTAELFAAPDRDLVDRAEAVVEGLLPLERCSDLEALRRRVPPPTDPAAARAVEAVRLELSEIEVLHRAGRFAQARQRLAELRPGANRLAYPPLGIDIRLLEASVLRSEGDFRAAERAFVEVFTHALQWRHDAAALGAAQMLSFTVGYELNRPQPGIVYAKIAAAMAEAEGDFAARLGVRNNVIAIHFATGEYEEVERGLRELIALREPVPSERARLGATYGNLGLVLHTLGRDAEAEAELRRSIELDLAAHGPDYPELAGTYTVLGQALASQLRFEDALAANRVALDLYGRTVAADHPEIATVRGNIGGILHALGRHAEAEQAFRHALQLREASYEPDHPKVASLRSRMTLVLEDLGRLDEAEAMHRAAVASFERTVGACHPSLAQALTMFGSFLERRGRADEARTPLQRAWACREREGIARERAETAFALARALGPSERGRALARGALVDCEAAGPLSAGQCEEIRGWLGEAR